MIRIEKPAEPPADFRVNAERDTQSIKADYDANQSLSFTRTYALAKEALVAVQHGKCAYTEAKVGHVAPEDVEHWRPKGAVRQDANSPEQSPGYYWLAYDWDNLFAASPRVNREFKRNLFPLADPSKRARSHHDDLADEDPLLLHPSRDEPENHIRFDGPVAKVRDDSVKGRTTIEVCGLNDKHFLNNRRERYEEVKGRFQALQKASPDEAEDYLIACIQDDAEYASMVRCAVRDGFKY